MPVIHTDACKLYKENLAVRRAERLAEFPKLCLKCGGVGGRREEDWSVGISELVYCDACLLQEKCPQCGETVDFDTDSFAYCTVCTWRETNDTAELPDPDAWYSCICE